MPDCTESHVGGCEYRNDGPDEGSLRKVVLDIKTSVHVATVKPFLQAFADLCRLSQVKVGWKPSSK